MTTSSCVLCLLNGTASTHLLTEHDVPAFCNTLCDGREDGKVLSKLGRTWCEIFTMSRMPQLAFFAMVMAPRVS